VARRSEAALLMLSTTPEAYTYPGKDETRRRRDEVDTCLIYVLYMSYICLIYVLYEIYLIKCVCGVDVITT
jgi:hypothetical protein